MPKAPLWEPVNLGFWDTMPLNEASTVAFVQIYRKA